MGKQKANWTILGHENVTRILDTHMKAISLPHAYLFVGPEGVGKKTLATQFAEKLTNHPSPHSDILHFDAGNGLDAASTREMIQLASLTPADSNRKVVIIDNMHVANNTVANMLLKTLEEPPSHTVFILISNGRLIDTIMSRCQMLSFYRLSSEQLTAYADSVNLSPSAEIISLSAGSIGRLHQLNAGGIKSEVLNELAALRTLSAQGTAEAMAAIGRLASLEDDVLVQVIEGWLYTQVEKLSEEPKMFVSVRAALDARAGIKSNFNKKMVLEQFVTSLQS